MKPQFFKTSAALRAWLEKHHADTAECLIGFYKKASGKQSISYKEAVDAALCFGWIDGVRNAIDEDTWKQRYTPRTKKSIWSAVNLKRYKELLEEGLVHASGEAMFNARDPKRTDMYSSEQKKELVLDDAALKLFKANKMHGHFLNPSPLLTNGLLSGLSSVQKKKKPVKKDCSI